MNTLLINGKNVPVPECVIISPNDEAWAHLSPGDCTARTKWPTQYVFHKTIADNAEHEMLADFSGTDPSGGASVTAEYWLKDPTHSGAHLVTGHNGVTACLADLVKTCAYHGNQANDRSVGHEMKELPGGWFYAKMMQNAITVALRACDALGIQRQVPHKYVDNKPLQRYQDGGTSLYGIFGHRDITDHRGKWDPGDLVFAYLEHRGCEHFDFTAYQDRDTWKKRQEWINKQGDYYLSVDGLPGTATANALKLIGFPDGIWAKGGPLTPTLP